jgi:hypothetical protein
VLSQRFWERVGAFLALILGVAALLLSQGLPRMEEGYPGPSLFPEILGVVLTASGLALFLAGGRVGALKAGLGRLGLPLLVAFLLFLAPWSLPHLGLVPTSALYAFLAALLLGAGWRGAIGAGLFVVLFTYLVFVRFLGVQG